MNTENPARRDVLRTGAALSGLAALGSLAGCSGLLDAEGGGGSGQLARVPEDADAAAHVDVETVLDDKATENVVDAQLAIQAERSWYDGPETFEAALSDFQDSTGLDPDGIQTATPFFEFAGSDSYQTVDQEFYGTVLTADWSEDDLIASIEDSGTEYEADEHAGQPVYEPDNDYSYWVGVLADGEYVLGSEDAVEDTIDVAAGEEDVLDSDLQNAYANTRAGPVRFVSTVPADERPETTGPSDEIDLGILSDVETVAGAVYVNGDNRGVEMTFTAADEETADDVAAMLDGLVTLASDDIPNDAVSSALDEVEITQDGTAVVVAYEASVATLVNLVEESLDTGSSGRTEPARQVPRAVFTFEYEQTGDGGTVTITHDGGDTIKRSEISVRGTGFAADSSADMTASGQWAGSASGEIGDEPAVVAGDRVTVGVESDYVLRITYESQSGDRSATLAASQGPDA